MYVTLSWNAPRVIKASVTFVSRDVFEQQLRDIEAQIDAWDQKKDALEKGLGNEQKKLESELNANDQKQEQEEHGQDIKEQKKAEEAEEPQEKVEAPEEPEGESRR